MPATELSARATAQLNSALAELGVTLPENRAGFRELVEGIDLTTDAGRDLQRKLQELVPSAAAYYQQLEQQQQQLEQQLEQKRQQEAEQLRTLTAAFDLAFVPAAELSRRAVEALRGEFAELGLAVPANVAKNYTIDPGVDNTAKPPSYLITATPKSGSTQVGDGNQTLSSTGAKTGTWR
ncbi:hypothetical protein D9M71_663130 [compost metagenome]